jgi:hypothetical protein
MAAGIFNAVGSRGALLVSKRGKTRTGKGHGYQPAQRNEGNPFLVLDGNTILEDSMDLTNAPCPGFKGYFNLEGESRFPILGLDHFIKTMEQATFFGHAVRPFACVRTR